MTQTTDSLNTDSLRKWARDTRRTAHRGFFRPDLLDISGLMINAAAVELDRLRAVIENAPHDSWCGWLNADRPAEESAACTCWKADAL